MLKFAIQQGWCRAIKNRFSSLSYWDEWTKLALHKSIQGLDQRVPCTLPILDPKILSKLEKQKEKVPKVSPKFKIGYGIQWTNDLMIEVS